MISPHTVVGQLIFLKSKVLIDCGHTPIHVDREIRVGEDQEYAMKAVVKTLKLGLEIAEELRRLGKLVICNISFSDVTRNSSSLHDRNLLKEKILNGNIEVFLPEGYCEWLGRFRIMGAEIAFCLQTMSSNLFTALLKHCQKAIRQNGNSRDVCEKHNALFVTDRGRSVFGVVSLFVYDHGKENEVMGGSWWSDPSVHIYPHDLLMAPLLNVKRMSVINLYSKQDGILCPGTYLGQLLRYDNSYDHIAVYSREQDPDIGEKVSREVRAASHLEPSFDSTCLQVIRPSSCEAVVPAWPELAKEFFANPASPHDAGKRCHELLTSARGALSSILGASPGDMYFSSGVTEAANLLIQGRAIFLKQIGSSKNEIIISAIEHAAVLAPALHLQKSGYKVHFAPVDENGVIIAERLFSLVSPNTAMVCLTAVNNETGSIQDVDRLARDIKEIGKETLVIPDASQATCKTVSKFNDVLGASMLVLVFQERLRKMELTYNHVKSLRELLLLNLDRQGVDFMTLVDPKAASLYILSLILPFIRTNHLVKALSDKGHYVSGKPACSSSCSVKSSILDALGKGQQHADSVVRISFGPENSSDDVLKLSGEIATLYHSASSKAAV